LASYDSLVLYIEYKLKTINSYFESIHKHFNACESYIGNIRIVKTTSEHLSSVTFDNFEDIDCTIDEMYIFSIFVITTFLLYIDENIVEINVGQHVYIINKLQWKDMNGSIQLLRVIKNYKKISGYNGINIESPQDILYIKDSICDCGLEDLMDKLTI